MDFDEAAQVTRLALAYRVEGEDDKPDLPHFDIQLTVAHEPGGAEWAGVLIVPSWQTMAEKPWADLIAELAERWPEARIAPSTSKSVDRPGSMVG